MVGDIIKNINLPNFENKKISKPIRLVYFITGMAIATILVVYGITWSTNSFEFTLFNISINRWIIAMFVVILGLLAGSLIKSAITGNSKLD